MSEPPRHDSTPRLHPIIRRIKNTDVCGFEDVIVLLLILLTTKNIFGIFLFDWRVLTLIWCFPNTQLKFFRTNFFRVLRYRILSQRIFFICRLCVIQLAVWFSFLFFETFREKWYSEQILIEIFWSYFFSR